MLVKAKHCRERSLKSRFSWGLAAMMLKSKRIYSVQTRTKSSWWWALGSSGHLAVQIAFCGKS